MSESEKPRGDPTGTTEPCSCPFLPSLLSLVLKPLGDTGFMAGVGEVEMAVLTQIRVLDLMPHTRAAQYGK